MPTPAGSTATPARRRLLQLLGVGFGLAVTVGSMLGVGILRTPALVAAQVPSAGGVLAVWIVGGLYSVLASICLTELGTMLPDAGGYYAYARRAFGDTVGYAVGWTDWICYGAVLGYVSIGMGEFVGVLAPGLAWATKPIALATVVLFAALQLGGVRLSAWFQQATTAVKFAAFLVLVVACLAYAAAGGAPAPPAAAVASPGLAGVVYAVQAVVITYGGFQSALYFAEEDRDPARNLPRSLIGGVSAVMLVYVLVNVALLAVLPVATLAGSTLAAADAAQLVFGGRGGRFITFLSIVSLPPLLNAILMIGARILYALGRDRLLWAGTAQVGASGTPGLATILTTVVAGALIVTGTFQTLIAVASVYLAANCFVTCVALMVLRRREPALARPFRAWGYPASALVVIAASGAFLAGTIAGDPRTAATAAGLLAAGFVVRPLAARLSPVPVPALDT
ncbi:MAG: APC family permease [Vicinamibacterales bacterium]